MEDERLSTPATIILDDEDWDSESSPLLETQEDIGPEIVPSVAVSGLLFESEIMALSQRFQDTEDALPLYVELEGKYTLIGYMELCVNNLLLLRWHKYKTTIFTPDRRRVDGADVSTIQSVLKVR